MEKLPKKIDIKVIARLNLPKFNLEKDKVYNAISYTKGNYEYYTIVDHNGRERGWISIENFMTLEDARNQKIEKIID